MDQSTRYDQTQQLKDYLSQPIQKRSIVIAGHATSVSLEQAFWDYLSDLAGKEGKSLNALVTEIDQSRSTSLSSALRLFVLLHATQT